jgi:hypothetical protein
MEYKRTALLTTWNIPIEITITPTSKGPAWVHAYDPTYGFEFSSFTAQSDIKILKAFMSENNKLNVFLEKSGTVLTINVIAADVGSEYIYFLLYDTLTKGDVTLIDILKMSNSPTDLLESFATVVKKFNKCRIGI